MVMNNKLKISNSLDLSISEEKISKKKAIELFELDLLGNLEPGKYETLSFIHKHLFSEIYDFFSYIFPNVAVNYSPDMDGKATMFCKTTCVLGLRPRAIAVIR